MHCSGEAQQSVALPHVVQPHARLPETDSGETAANVFDAQPFVEVVNHTWDTSIYSDPYGAHVKDCVDVSTTQCDVHT